MYYYIDKEKHKDPGKFPYWHHGKVCPNCNNEGLKTYLLPGEYIEGEGYTNFKTSKSEYYRYQRLDEHLSNPEIKCECGWTGKCSELF